MQPNNTGEFDIGVSSLQAKTHAAALGKIHQVSIQSLAFCCSTHPSLWVKGVGIREYFRVHENKVVCGADRSLQTDLV